MLRQSQALLTFERVEDTLYTMGFTTGRSVILPISKLKLGFSAASSIDRNGAQ